MIKTPNSYFLHVPKTAGTWLYSVLEPITIEEKEHGIPDPNFRHTNVYAFVRNPWSWYVSMYTFYLHGSEFGMPDSHISESFLISIGPSASFEDFLQACCNPTKDFKLRVFNNYTDRLKESLLNQNNILDIDEKVNDDFLFKIHKTWLDNDVSFYEQAASVYLNFCTKVGRYENIQQDLIDMLTESGDINPEVKSRIESTPKINVTTIQNSYTDYYNSSTIDLVEKTSQFLKTHNYKFKD